MLKKAIIGLTLGLLALATVSVVSAQGRVNTMCAGYSVEIRQQTDGYDMLLTVPLPPAGFQGVHLEVDGLHPQITPRGEGNNVFRIPYNVYDIGSEHHYYANSWTRSGGVIIYSCTDISTFKVKL